MAHGTADERTYTQAADRWADCRIEDFLTYKVSTLRKKLDRRATLLLARDSGLKLTQWRVLGNLEADVVASVGDLALRIHTDKSQVSRAFAELEKRGLVARRANPTDARSVLFQITAAGLDLQTEVMARRRQEQAQLAEVLAPRECDTLVSALAKLEAWVDARSADVETTGG